MKKIFVIMLSALILAACAEAPEEVKRENEVLDRTEDAVRENAEDSRDELTLSTMEEIRAALENDIRQNATNVSAAKVFVSDAESMPVYTIKRHFGTVDVFKKIIAESLGSCDEGDLGHSEDGHSYFQWSPTEVLNYNNECEGSWFYPDTTDKKEAPKFFYSDCGMFIHSEGDPYAGEVADTYDLRKGDTFPEEKLTLTDGGRCSVAEAVKESEEEAEKYISRLFCEGMSVRVYMASVYRQDSGSSITMYADIVMPNGAPVLCGAKIAGDVMSRYYDGKSPMMPENILVFSKSGAGKPADVIINRTPAPDEQTESGDRLLSYGEAVKLLSSRLATASAYEFDCASLEYVISAPYSERYCAQAVYGDGSAFMDFYNELYYHMDDNREYLRPCWVFRDLSKQCEGENEWVQGGIYTVDALTGEIGIY
ncbi:MAG: hypothetical protein IJ746_00300 [Ruminococcus sp.]|nr:hypothetical protein [Ruminococcus sp.]